MLQRVMEPVSVELVLLAASLKHRTRPSPPWYMSLKNVLSACTFALHSHCVCRSIPTLLYCIHHTLTQNPECTDVRWHLQCTNWKTTWIGSQTLLLFIFYCIGEIRINTDTEEIRANLTRAPVYTKKYTSNAIPILIYTIYKSINTLVLNNGARTNQETIRKVIFMQIEFVTNFHFFTYHSRQFQTQTPTLNP